MDVIETIKKQIAAHPALLYMKGTPQFPQCGFSAKVAQLLKSHKANFGYVNILEFPNIRAELPKYADWPTFPQLYLEGELVGGADIVVELDNDQELEPLLKHANVIDAASSHSVNAAQ